MSNLKKMLIFFTLFVFFSCQNSHSIQKAYKSNVIVLTDYSPKLSNKYYDAIVYEFLNPTYVSKIYFSEKNEKTNLKAFTNKQVFKFSTIDTLSINDYIEFLFIFPENYNNIQGIKGFNSNSAYEIIKNKPAALLPKIVIKNINNEEYYVCKIPTPQKNTELFNLINKNKITKALIETTYGYLYRAFSQDYDTILVAFLEKKNSVIVKKYIFYKNLVEKINGKTQLFNNNFELRFDNFVIYKEFNDTDLVDLSTISDKFIIDIKYATEDNFLKKRIYNCAKAYLRYKAAKDLLKALDTAVKLGYKIKIFDAYRPFKYQQIMWNNYPNKNFVAPPSNGSMHNRAIAIDVTLTDSLGKELDMGTTYDFFGYQAYSSYNLLTQKQINNRNFLKKIMKYANFDTIRTEWWHFYYKNAFYNILDIEPICW